MITITSVRIVYLRAFGERIVDRFRWSAENGYTATVDNLAVAANLLTYPRPDFALSPDEPLLSSYTAEEIVQAVIDQALSGSAATYSPALEKPRRKHKTIED